MTPTNEAGHGLPELPEPDVKVFNEMATFGSVITGYTADQMRQYARAALALSSGVPDAVASRLRGLIAEIDSHRKPATGELRLVADELKSILALAAAPAAAGAQGEDGCESCGRRDPLQASDYRSALDTLSDFNPGADEYTSAIDLLRQHTPLPQPAAADGGVREQHTAAAEHWHGLYRKECRLRQDDAARYGQQIVDLEAALSSHRQAGDGDPVPNVIHDFKKLRFGVERVIHELRTYWPAADEYKGEHIHKVWARELESLLALVEKGAGS